VVKDALGEVQSILVLGGNSEIGKAIAEKLVANRNARVRLAVRTPDERSDEVDSDLRIAGAAEVTSTEFDALDFADHADWVDMMFDIYGDFDVVIVAFGVLGDQELTEHDMRAALDVVQTNFTATVAIGVPLVERMRKQGHGTIVFLSSVAGERVRRSNYTYGASKAGADGWFQGVAAALQGSGVHVMIVRPGFVHTKMTEGMKAAPLSVTPDQVADAVVTGLRRRKEIVWVPGAMRYVMAILRHMPTIVFRRLPM
jgi:decaprenylphospho-beta-D-erythro-pentofuranosid-2-ulose 2-reductase